MKRFASILLVVLASLGFRAAIAQDAPATRSPSPAAGASDDFLKAADEVVKEMSAILALLNRHQHGRKLVSKMRQVFRRA